MIEAIDYRFAGRIDDEGRFVLDFTLRTSDQRIALTLTENGARELSEKLAIAVAKMETVRSAPGRLN